jgi:hypothetical protein
MAAPECAAELLQLGLSPVAHPALRPDGADGASFPLLLACEPTSAPTLADTLEWLSGHREAVETALRKHGVLFLRGLPLTGPPDFDALMQSLGVPPKPYVGGAAVRYVVHGDVFTANESPAQETIPCVPKLGTPAPPGGTNLTARAASTTRWPSFRRPPRA